MSDPSARTPFASTDLPAAEVPARPLEVRSPAVSTGFDLTAWAWLATLPISAVVVFFLLQDALLTLGDLAR